MEKNPYTTKTHYSKHILPVDKSTFHCKIWLTLIFVTCINLQYVNPTCISSGWDNILRRRLFPFYFSNITLRTDLLTFRVTGAVFKIASEKRQLPAYFDNPGNVINNRINRYNGSCYLAPANDVSRFIFLSLNHTQATIP